MPDRDIGFSYDRWLEYMEDRAMQDTDEPVYGPDDEADDERRNELAKEVRDEWRDRQMEDGR